MDRLPPFLIYQRPAKSFQFGTNALQRKFFSLKIYFFNSPSLWRKTKVIEEINDKVWKQ